MHLLINLNPNAMVKHYVFLLFAISSLGIFAQNACDDANSDLIYAYSHVKSSYNANNISHLKYYANRSLESFERSKKKLKECGCETAYDLAFESAQLLSKVETAETYEDGRFFVKRARDIAQESVTALDKCTVSTSSPMTSSTGDSQLSSLQMEQERLKQQQEELKRRAEEINAKLAQQNEMELKLKKEQMINSYKSAISSNVESYNNSLKVCNCISSLIKVEDNTDVSTKSLEEIKTYYLNSLKGLTSNYLAQLNSCNK